MEKIDFTTRYFITVLASLGATLFYALMMHVFYAYMSYDAPMTKGYGTFVIISSIIVCIYTFIKVLKEICTRKSFKEFLDEE
jgi:hypothetical protein